MTFVLVNADGSLAGEPVEEEPEAGAGQRVEHVPEGYPDAVDWVPGATTLFGRGGFADKPVDKPSALAALVDALHTQGVLTSEVASAILAADQQGT